MPLPTTPNAIDLVDLEMCKAWLNMPNNNDDDNLIQLLITGFSQYVLDRTGRDSFNSVSHYIEIYDGNNAQRMFLRNTPIASVNSIIVGSFGIAPSTGLTAPGWYIEQSKKSIALRTVGVFASYVQGGIPYVTMPMRFAQGMGNIQVDYTAGFSAVPFDLQEACMKVVGQNYRRKDWIDIATKALSAGGATSGSTRYRSWDMPPEVRDVILFYQRRALV